jgi:protein-disulfide isomerase
MAEKRVAPGRGKAPGVVRSSQSGSKKGFYILIAVVAVAGIGTLSYLSGRTRKSSAIAIDPNLPPVTSAGYVMGSPTAPLEVIEFGDLECPACNQFAEVTEPDVRAQLINTGRIRFRFIDCLILSAHRNTLNASVAAACADEQGQFWPLHDLLYAKQDEWNGEATNNPDKVIKALAHTIPGLDASKFDECLDSRRTLPRVQAHIKLGDERGVRGTPTFVFGSKMYSSVMGIDAFKQAVNEALAEVDSAKAAAAKTAGKPTKTAAKTTKKP